MSTLTNYLSSSLIRIVLLIIVPLISCEQFQHTRLGRKYAEEELRVALLDSTAHNVITGNSLLIKDSNLAIAVAEPILFAIYGRDNIIRQRPYETYLIDNYWIISGTLTKGYLGGTFLIILDATNAKIIRLTHYK
jgi:hypothetical protein